MWPPAGQSAGDVIVLPTNLGDFWPRHVGEAVPRAADVVCELGLTQNPIQSHSAAIPRIVWIKEDWKRRLIEGYPEPFPSSVMCRGPPTVSGDVSYIPIYS